MLSKKAMAAMMTASMAVTSVAPSVAGQTVSEHAVLLNSQNNNNNNGVTASATRNIWLKAQLNKVIKMRNLDVSKLGDDVVMNFQNYSGFIPVGKIFLSTNTNLNGVMIQVWNKKGNMLTQGIVEKQEESFTTPTGDKINVPYYVFSPIAGTDRYSAQPGNDVPFGLNDCYVKYQNQGQEFSILKNKEGKDITFTQNVIPLTFYTEDIQVPKLKVGTKYKYGNGVNILGTVVPFKGKNGVPTVRVCSNFGGNINFYPMNEKDQANSLASINTTLANQAANNTVAITNAGATKDWDYNPAIIYNTIEADAFNEPGISVEVKTQNSKEYPHGQYVGLDSQLHDINPLITQNVLQQNLKGVPYSKADINKPIVPKGYTIIGMSINGQEIHLSKGETYENYPLPTYFENGNQNIVYTIAKVSTDTVTVQLKDGRYVTNTGALTDRDVSQQTAKGQVGESTNLILPTIPKNYYISEIIVNNKKLSESEMKDYKLPKKFDSNDNKILYILSEYKTQVNAKYVDINTKKVVDGGKFSLSEGAANVIDGITSTTVDGLQDITASETKIPNGYKISGKQEVTSNIENGIKIINIIQHIEKIPECKIIRIVQIKDPEGNIIKTLETSVIAKGLEGTTVIIPSFKNPDSSIYTMTESGVKSGKETLKTDGTQTITLTQNPATLTIESKIGDKVEGNPVVESGIVGDIKGIGQAEVVAGYHVGSVTVDGNTYTGKEMENVPKEIKLTGTNKVVYNLVPNNTVTIIRKVEVIDPYTNKPVHVDGITESKVVASGLEGT
ncbi:MAG: hypothetical protein ACRC41_08160, partial [Sarcina sp.]